MSLEDQETGIIPPAEPTLTPYWAAGLLTLYHADCRVLLPQLSTLDVPVGCILTAPPFRGGHYLWQLADAVTKAEQTDPRQFAKWETDTRWAIDKRAWFMTWLPWARYLLDRAGVMWLFTVPHLLQPIMAVLALLEWPIRFACLKEHEALLFVGHRALGGPAIDQVSVAFKQAPAQARVPELDAALIGVLLDAVAGFEGAVLDPFVGESAGVLLAARARGLRGIGIEIDQRRCDKAILALEAAA